MTYIVCPTKNRNLSGVFCFAFDSDLEAAEKFAADITLATWEAWRGVGSPSGFSGCEGLAMYLHASTNEDHTEFVVVSVFVQGKKFAADHFDEPQTTREQVLDQVRTILSGIPEDTGLTADEVRLEVAERIVEGFPKGIQPDVDIDLAQAANLINEAGTYLGGTLHPEQ